MVVGEALALIGAELDDPTFAHATPSVAIRQLNRAQQWVGLAYKLLREDSSVALITEQALVYWPLILPNVAGIIGVSLNGAQLWPIAWKRLHLSDPAWLSTPGTPQHWYRLGLSYVGFYPVATGAITITLTGVQVPTALTSGGDVLQVPDGFLPQVIQVATGLLLLGSERAYHSGLQMIATGLGLPTPTRRVEQAAPMAGAA